MFLPFFDPLSLPHPPRCGQTLVSGSTEPCIKSWAGPTAQSGPEWVQGGSPGLKRASWCGFVTFVMRKTTQGRGGGCAIEKGSWNCIARRIPHGRIMVSSPTELQGWQSGPGQPHLGHKDPRNWSCLARVAPSAPFFVMERACMVFSRATCHTRLGPVREVVRETLNSGPPADACCLLLSTCQSANQSD